MRNYKNISVRAIVTIIGLLITLVCILSVIMTGVGGYAYFHGLNPAGLGWFITGMSILGLCCLIPCLFCLITFIQEKCRPLHDQERDYLSGYY